MSRLDLVDKECSILGSAFAILRGSRVRILSAAGLYIGRGPTENSNFEMTLMTDLSSIRSVVEGRFIFLLGLIDKVRVWEVL